MARLDLYKDREPHIITLEVDGEPKDFKIPVSYTVDEVERLIEIQVMIDKLAKEEVDENRKEDQFSNFFDAVFNQVLILFQRYQPEITVETLKKMLTRDDAVAIINFHTKEKVKFADNQAPDDGSKKKAQSKS